MRGWGCVSVACFDCQKVSTTKWLCFLEEENPNLNPLGMCSLSREVFLWALRMKAQLSKHSKCGVCNPKPAALVSGTVWGSGGCFKRGVLQSLPMCVPWGMIYFQLRVNFSCCFWSSSKTIVSVKNSRIWLVCVWQSSAPACSTGQCGDVSSSEYLNVVFSAAYLGCCLKAVVLNVLLFLALYLS